MFVSGTQILNNSWVLYIHNIPLMIKMLNVGPRQQAWVSWSADVLLIANTGDPASSCECWLFLFQVDEWRSKEPHKSKKKTQNMD